MNKVLEDLHAYIAMARDEQNQSDNSSVRVRDKCIVDLAAEVERLEAELSELNADPWKRRYTRLRQAIARELVTDGMIEDMEVKP